VSGPFLSLKAAQRAALTVLGTHTCMDAQVWSADQVNERAALRGSLRQAEADAIREAQRLLAIK
jgi:hypothetical protein